ncbi:MAG: flagellar basal body L-ring protein FlgH [Amaricoccus sp.]
MTRFSALALLLALGACGIGQEPEMTTIGATDPAAKPLLTPERAALAVPPPEAARYNYQQGSLWSTGSTALLGDRRAKSLGDILTVVVEIDDEGEMQNTTNRARSGSEQADLTAAFGATNLLPFKVDMLSPRLDMSGDSSYKGNGKTQRNEKLKLRIAATVVEVLPNGDLVIQGDQEVRLNYELRDLQVAGIVRPEDISRYNEIPYDRIAGARIAYGGRGQVYSAQQPRWGQQATDKVLPY